MPKEIQILFLISPIFILFFVVSLAFVQYKNKLHRKAVYKPAKYRLYWSILFIIQSMLLTYRVLNFSSPSVYILPLGVSTLYSLYKITKQ